MILFIDTETNGLPLNWKAPSSDTSNWPRVVQVACILSDIDGNIIEEFDCIVKPSNFIVSRESTRLHGIGHDVAVSSGLPLREVLQRLNTVVRKCHTIVCHNTDFDLPSLKSEFIRADIATNLLAKTNICTMKNSMNYCRIPGNNGYKWPKLSELHFKLFGTYFQESHNAKNDIKATFKCFWKLCALNIIRLPNHSLNTYHQRASLYECEPLLTHKNTARKSQTSHSNIEDGKKEMAMAFLLILTVLCIIFLMSGNKVLFGVGIVMSFSLVAPILSVIGDLFKRKENSR